MNSKISHLNCEDAICLLDGSTTDIKIRSYALHSFRHIDYAELMCYMPFLIFSMRYENIENSKIGNFVIEMCISTIEPNQLEICNEVYFEFCTQMDPNRINDNNDDEF